MLNKNLRRRRRRGVWAAFCIVVLITTLVFTLLYFMVAYSHFANDENHQLLLRGTAVCLFLVNAYWFVCALFEHFAHNPEDHENGYTQWLM